jgi:hypothetical protein
VKQFIESINETANSVYYVYAGRHQVYPSGDTVVPDIINSVDETLYTSYNEMLFGKRVGPTDVVPMVPRYDWSTNTSYSAYRSSEDLTDKQFYVVVNDTTYDVFKCLDNNSNTPSTVAPKLSETSAADEFYSTSDGYVWKYMYSVDSTTFNKFATQTSMPVIANNDVVANAVSGAVDVILTAYPGSNYNTYLSNTFLSSDIRVGGDALKYNIANNATSSNNFYTGSFIYIKNGTGNGQGRRIVDYTVIGSTKTIELDTAFNVAPDVTSQYEITPAVVITGDGTGAIARALVNTASSNSISQVEIVTRGSGYTYASARVTGNTSGTTNTAVLGIVLGPKNGHGSDPSYELGSTSLCISTTFANSEVGTIPVTNDYRSIGLVKDPLFANVQFTVGSLTGVFSIGETVTQPTTGAVGIVTEFDNINTLTLTNVSGIFLTGNSTVNPLQGGSSGATSSLVSYQINGQAKNFNTFDQRNRFTFTPIVGSFIPDEEVYQTDVQLANAVFHSNTSANIYLTHVRGTLNTGNSIIGQLSGASATLVYAYPPDLVIGSGEVLYVENGSAISRSNSQSETVKIILQF